MECWICLSGEDNEQNFKSFCSCPSSVRPVHAKCLGRWQLQRAGTREETHCRFCESKYQLDWRSSLTPPTGLSSSGSGSSSDSSSGGSRGELVSHPPQRRPPTPVMAIFFEGQVHRIKVYPGPEGKARFQQQIRELVQLGDDEDFDVQFECRAPASGDVLHLDGMDAFDAATHCAALTAAERLSKQQQEQEQRRQQQQQHQQQLLPNTTIASNNSSSRRSGSAVADVQLQLASQHGTADSCPGN